MSNGFVGMTNTAKGHACDQMIQISSSRRKLSQTCLPIFLKANRRVRRGSTAARRDKNRTHAIFARLGSGWRPIVELRVRRNPQTCIRGLGLQRHEPVAVWLAQ